MPLNIIYLSPFILVPIEMTILIKEHFNRWYSLKAYYFAMTLVDLPITVGSTPNLSKNCIKKQFHLHCSLSVLSCFR